MTLPDGDPLTRALTRSFEALPGPDSARLQEILPRIEAAAPRRRRIHPAWWLLAGAGLAAAAGVGLWSDRSQPSPGRPAAAETVPPPQATDNTPRPAEQGESGQSRRSAVIYRGE